MWHLPRKFVAVMFDASDYVNHNENGINWPHQWAKNKLHFLIFHTFWKFYSSLWSALSTESLINHPPKLIKTSRWTFITYLYRPWASFIPSFCSCQGGFILIMIESEIISNTNQNDMIGIKTFQTNKKLSTGWYLDNLI